MSWARALRNGLAYPIAAVGIVVMIAAPSVVPALASSCVATFGPGIAPPEATPPLGIEGYHSAWYGQSGYARLCPGQRATFTIAFLNTGSLGWYAGTVDRAAYLGTWGPDPGQDRPSPLGGDGTQGSPDTGWPSCDRVAVQRPAYVGPGQVGWFTFDLRAPLAPGWYRLDVRPLIERAQWLEDAGIYWQLVVLFPDGSLPPTPGTSAEISVRSTGAVGDGVADDTEAILRARGAAGVSGQVTFPPGTYRFTRELRLNIPGQKWVLRSGATLAAEAGIVMDASGLQLLGPGRIDERHGVRMGVDIEHSGSSPVDGDVIDGVEFTDLGSSTYAAFVIIKGSYAQLRNSFLHDSGADGALLNTDGSARLTGVEVRNNRFEDIVRDGFHSKGTNVDWVDGTWLPAAQLNVGHKFIGNVMVNTSQVPDTFSLEIQDGHMDTEIRDNWADHTYSIVGQLRAVVAGNTFVGTGASSWGMEY
ncbi:MAG: hypothetical protein KGQ88_08495, partial [Chloroflexi bacterium]|nr:hypothetical protein [Chloroflexota bacterium]